MGVLTRDVLDSPAPRHEQVTRMRLVAEAEAWCGGRDGKKRSSTDRPPNQLRIKAASQRAFLLNSARNSTTTPSGSLKRRNES